jgi:hypothetical protein
MGKTKKISTNATSPQHIVAAGNTTTTGRAINGIYRGFFPLETFFLGRPLEKEE